MEVHCVLGELQTEFLYVMWIHLSLRIVDVSFMSDLCIFMGCHVKFIYEYLDVYR
jgi:hypothetical protein